MIGRLTGLVAEKSPPLLLLDVGGVGYELDVPMSSYFQLPAVGERVTLHTHFVVREDAQVLFGFLRLDERAAFRELIRISGIGPRTALSVLSGLSVDDLVDAVARQDAARLVKVPGIGKKTAERLLLELKDRLAPAAPGGSAAASPDGSALRDIEQALAALGYSERDAQAATKALPPGIGVSEGIKAALRTLAR